MSTSTRFRQALAIVEHGSFRRAAAALKITQPALTKSVQALEAELGVKLFDRQPGAITLTESGRRVAEYSRNLVSSEEDLLHDLALIAGLESGSLNVALGPYPSAISGYPAAARLSGRYPKLRIGLHVASWRMVTEAVAERRVDLGMAELSSAARDSSMASETLRSHRARIFCRPGHPILQRKRIALPDLLQFPWAATRLPRRVIGGFPSSPGKAGWIDLASGDLVPAIELDVPMHLAAFAAESDTLVFGVFVLVERELQDGRLAVVPIDNLGIESQYGFLWLKHRSRSPATLAFMQAVREEEQLFEERETKLAQLYR